MSAPESADMSSAYVDMTTTTTANTATTTTHTYHVIHHPLSAPSIFYDPLHPSCSIYVPDSLFPQSFSKFSLVYILAWHPPLHTLHISSPNHCLLFTAHAHAIATCFAVVPKLSHLFLVSLSTLFLELCFVA